MREISIEELHQYSVGPKRLAAQQSPRQRSPEKDFEEYNIDKFGAWLRYCRAHPDLSFDEMKRYDRGISEEKETCFSQNHKLFVATASEAFDLEKRLFIQSFEGLMGRCDTVLELAAGFGFMSSLLAQRWPEQRYIAAELCPNGRALGEELDKNSKISFLPFDFLDQPWKIFDTLLGRRVLVFCHFGIFLMPDAVSILNELNRHKVLIPDILLFEPLFEVERSQDQLSEMRQRYILMNGYNRNLLSSIQNSGAQILELQEDFFGVNPLFPAAKIHLRYA